MQKYLPLAILSTAFVALLLFLSTRNSLNFVEEQKQTVPTTAPAPTEIKWQTYRNEKYGFEFQYPENLHVVIDPYTKKDTVLITEDTQQTVSPGGWSGVFINVLSNYSKFNSETFVKKEMLKDELNTNVVIKKENIIDIDATTTTGEIVGGNADSTPKTYISNDKYIFVISANSQNYISLYTQILSTFKFTTPTAVVTKIPNSDKLISEAGSPLYFYLNNQKHSVEESADYPGKVIYSPDKKFACIEWGSSGYWGYHLYNLTSDSDLAIINGPQYSYCQSFSATKLIVKEKPYDTKKSEVYSIDLQSLNKTLVSSVDTGIINSGVDISN